MLDSPAIRRPKLRATPLLRCGLAALACIVVEYTLLNVLVRELHVHYLLASVLAGLVYLVLNFALNRRWAFRARDVSLVPQLLRHGLVTGGGIALATPLLWFFVAVARLPFTLGWVASGLIAFLAWTFPMHRWFTYRRPAAALACAVAPQG